MNAPLWTPTTEEVEQTRLTAFVRQVNDQWGTAFAPGDYAGLWRWSVDNLEEYWVSAWDFCAIIAETRGERVRVYRSEPLLADSAAAYPSTVKLELAGLPTNFMPLFAGGRTAFVPEGEHVVVHGGVSVEELIVPFVKVSYVVGHE